MLARVLRSACLLSVGLAGSLGLATQLNAAETPIHHVTSETCQTCHEDIYKQWSKSMHASSSAMKDPIHATFYKNVVGDPTQEGVLHKASGKYPVCLQCHAPNAARDKTTKLDANPAYAEGVNCVACHTLKKYNGIQGPDGKLRLGLKAYDISDAIQAPTGMNRGLANLSSGGDLFGGAVDADQKPNPHLGEAVTVDGKEIPALPMEGNPRQLKTSDACMGCHDKRNNPHGVPLCMTGNEYTESAAKVDCLSCHMPIAEGGVADHSMGGGHSHAMLKRSLVFDMDVEQNGGNLKASLYLKNQQPHSLPTGAPFRNMHIKVTAYDSNGQVVWQNAEGHPAKADPQAYLVLVLADDEGKPTSPPKATQLGKDTRLKPFEERTLTYEIPAEGVALVRSEVYYSLLWPGLAEQFKHLPEDLRTPVLVAESESSVGGS